MLVVPFDEPFRCIGCRQPILKFRDVLRDRTLSTGSEGEVVGCEPNLCSACTGRWLESSEAKFVLQNGATEEMYDFALNKFCGMELVN